MEPLDEIIYEFTIYKNIMKVSVIDPKTGREVCFQAPWNTPKSELKRIGRQKLERSLRRA